MRCTEINYNVSSDLLLWQVNHINSFSGTSFNDDVGKCLVSRMRWFIVLINRGMDEKTGESDCEFGRTD
jgi:hypothetical protein